VLAFDNIRDFSGGCGLKVLGNKQKMVGSTCPCSMKLLVFLAHWQELA